MAAKEKSKQLELKPMLEKRFSIERLVQKKMESLSQKIDSISYADVVWLSRIEDFLTKNEYLTERQMDVLDTISRRYIQ